MKTKKRKLHNCSLIETWGWVKDKDGKEKAVHVGYFLIGYSSARAGASLKEISMN